MDTLSNHPSSDHISKDSEAKRGAKKCMCGKPSTKEPWINEPWIKEPLAVKGKKSAIEAKAPGISGLPGKSLSTKEKKQWKQSLLMLERRLFKRVVSFLDWRCPCCDGVLAERRARDIATLLRPGDILLETNNAYPGWQIAVKLTLGTNWTHSAYYAGGNEVIDSGTLPRVARIPLNDFLNTSHIALLRPRYQERSDIDAATAYVESCMGKPFNVTFDHHRKNRYYCAQLISNALESMPHPIRIARRRMLWKKVVSPEDLEKNPQIDCLWTSDPFFIINLCHHWPLFAAMILGALAGQHGGALGIICGAIFSVWLLTVLSQRLRKKQLSMQIKRQERQVPRGQKGLPSRRQ